METFKEFAQTYEMIGNVIGCFILFGMCAFDGCLRYLKKR